MSTVGGKAVNYRRVHRIVRQNHATKKKIVYRPDNVLALQNVVERSTSFLHEDHTCLNTHRVIYFSFICTLHKENETAVQTLRCRIYCSSS